TRQPGGNRDDRKLYLRQRRDRKKLKSQHPGQEQSDRKKRCSDGPPNEGSRNVHDLLHSQWLLDGISHAEARKSSAQAVKREVNHRSRIESQKLAEEQTTNDRDAKRIPQLRTSS